MPDDSRYALQKYIRESLFLVRMIIFIIRHGQTTGDLEDRYGGDYDDDLSDEGKRQASRLAEKLACRGIQVIYHSPRARALQTASIVSKRIGAKRKEIYDLRERNNYGIITGMTKSEAISRYPDEVEKLKKDKIRHHVTGSEDYDSLRSRVLGAFESILDDDGYDTIAIISHGGPIGCIFRDYLKLGEIEQLGDCAICELEKSKGKLRLISLDNARLQDR